MSDSAGAAPIPFWKVVILGLCAMEVGPNLALSAAFQLHISGRQSWLVIALAALTAMLVASAISLFAQRQVATGSILSYVRTALPEWGICVTATCVLLGYILGATSSVVGAAMYASTLLLRLGIPNATGFASVAVLMLIVSAGAAVSACRGVEVSARVALALGLICIPVAIGVTVAASCRSGIQIHDEIFRHDTSWLAAGRGLFVALGFFVGFDGISTLASETDDPKRNVGRVFRWTLGLTALAVVAAALLQTPILLEHSAALDAGESPTSILSRVAGLSGVDVASDTLLCMATIAGLIAWVNFAALIVANAASDGYLPRSLATVHPRYGTPHRAVLFLCLIAWLIPLAVELITRTSVLTTIIYLTNMSQLFWLIPYTLVCVAALGTLRRERRLLDPTAMAAATAAVLLVAVMVMEAIWPTDSTAAMMERLSLALVVAGSAILLRRGSEATL